MGQFRNRRKVGTPPAAVSGHMLPMPFLLCTKQSTQRLIVITVTLKIKKAVSAAFNACRAHCPWWVFNLLLNAPVIVLKAPIFDTFCIISARPVRMEDVFFNPIPCCTDCVRAFRFSVVVQRMGLAHYARHLGCRLISTCLFTTSTCERHLTAVPNVMSDLRFISPHWDTDAIG